ncbi:sigma-54-dependent transcriptional regulator [Pseudobacteriovorax antillogorgiicola]|uniref:Two-component system, NtrC family, response regulator n=1 Tax=Pseudobacteriovorax antillogorgiicola TaxID=1513793 RepID=A0A1Y6B6S4_9BACT|nr:sigma 54-interacting transcriptional regulator [Pseudobacteriovorax antillogorgiicola]TCS58736.1 two-component system NtrC family response regulator [Pseudobacteriovorax antillogorgiicola]SME95271.1 two-component system, NtrC family, response regulator [Pseudobacteriovorax antillogorgiicola]
MSTILIVEDSKDQLAWYQKLVDGTYEYFVAGNLDQAKILLDRECIDVLLTDIHLTPGASLQTFEGLELIKYSKLNHPEILVLAMSADPDISTYRKAMRQGADYWVKKPVVEIEELHIAIDAARQSRTMISSSEKVNYHFSSRSNRFGDGLVLDVRTRKYAEGIAKSKDIACVIYGETGTGKEEVAKLIHKRRCDLEGALPFMAVNCAQLNSTMSESILFGHKKGAFTGADKTTNGMIGEANGGILFLDEIHRLSEECQSKLLRVLNDGTYQRLGDSKTLKSEFQVIVASGKDLDEAVEEGQFLMDLRSRITGIDIHLKPLRERKDDIDLLVPLFFAKERIEIDKVRMAKVVEKCKKYYWQGNIRQLFNVLKSFLTICSLNEVPLEASLMPEYKTMFEPGYRPSDRDFLEGFNWERPIKESLGEIECEILRRALDKYRNKTKIVNILEMNRSTFESRMSRYNLN